MDIVNPAIDRYLQELSRPDDPLLLEMERLAAERSFPIVGSQVGRLLHVLARAISARRIIELGSGFGYSAYWFARAVGPTGRVILTEGSADRAEEARDFLTRGGLIERVRIVTGDALEIVERCGAEFDIVFNDVDKRQYPLVPRKAAAVLRPGGLLISDNMLWSGTVIDRDSREESTRGVQDMTRQLEESDEFETSILPLRDGLSISIYRA